MQKLFIESARVLPTFNRNENLLDAARENHLGATYRVDSTTITLRAVLPGAGPLCIIVHLHTVPINGNVPLDLFAPLQYYRIDRVWWGFPFGTAGKQPIICVAMPNHAFGTSSAHKIIQIATE